MNFSLSRRQYRLSLLSAVLLCSTSLSFAQALLDSIPKPKPVKLSMTTLFNTGSMFYFTGVVSDNRPSYDMRVTYDRPKWGALLFKSFDLTDHNPGINYALIVLNKKYSIGKRISIIPQIGTQLNQIERIAGEGSDILTNLTIAYRFGKFFSVSNDAVMQNLVFTNKANWTNRIKLAYQRKDFAASASLWDRNRIFGNPGYLSGGFYAAYTGVKLPSNMRLVLTASSVSVLRADTPRKSGFMISGGVTF